MSLIHNERLIAFFDELAGNYDAQQATMAPIWSGLYFLLQSVFVDLPADARVLCVGAGTGSELTYLAEKFPRWRFTAVEPSEPMLSVCRRRAEASGFASRCHFHEGYLDTLVSEDGYDGATCLLVSHFILERKARSEFFRAIASRLRPGGILATSDLAEGSQPKDFESLLTAWVRRMAGSDGSVERMAEMREMFVKNMAILPPVAVASIIESGGFEAVVQFFQAELLHAWCAKRAPKNTA